MAELYPKGYGISVIVGLNEGQVSLLVQAAHSGQTPVYLSDVNAPQQIVITGSEEGMSKVLESARKYGASKAQRLDVTVPSHCLLLQPVADALRESLKAIRLQKPKMVYAGNVTGRALRSAESVSEDLASNIAHGVRWYDATTVLEELGCRLFLEMPPGHVLSELARRAFPDVKTLAIGEVSIHEALVLAGRFTPLRHAPLRPSAT
jgi:malonate decarboxylase epsilon subunit